MAKERIKLGHIALAVAPLIVTPGFLYALAEGWVDFGGGGKDILIALPFFLLVLIFFITAVIPIIKRWSLWRWVVRSSIISVSTLLGLGVVVYVTSWLGVA